MIYIIIKYPEQKMGESMVCGAKWRCLAADLSDMEGNDQYNHAPPNTSVKSKNKQTKKKIGKTKNTCIMHTWNI